MGEGAAWAAGIGDTATDRAYIGVVSLLLGGLIALAVTAVVLSPAVGGEPLKSGLPVGDSPTPFHPLNVTGPFAGQKQCLV